MKKSKSKLEKCFRNDELNLLKNDDFKVEDEFNDEESINTSILLLVTKRNSVMKLKSKLMKISHR